MGWGQITLYAGWTFCCTRLNEQLTGFWKKLRVRYLHPHQSTPKLDSHTLSLVHTCIARNRESSCPIYFLVAWRERKIDKGCKSLTELWKLCQSMARSPSIFKGMSVFTSERWKPFIVHVTSVPFVVQTLKLVIVYGDGFLRGCCHYLDPNDRRVVSFIDSENNHVFSTMFPV